MTELAQKGTLKAYTDEAKSAQQELYKLGYYGNFKPLADGRINTKEFREAVRAFQKAHHLTPDGIVGEKTAAALQKDFQAAYVRTKGEIQLDIAEQFNNEVRTLHLKRNDIRMNASQSAIRSNSFASYGDSGQEVKEIQTLLKRHGYEIKVDGFFGAKTKAIVMQYQKSNSIQVDGFVGKETIRYLVQFPTNLAGCDLVCNYIGLRS
jgi:peptidoglycan hydrolase-like protein with peptidoglycan-binding domain